MIPFFVPSFLLLPFVRMVAGCCAGEAALEVWCGAEMESVREGLAREKRAMMEKLRGIENAKTVSTK